MSHSRSFRRYLPLLVVLLLALYASAQWDEQVLHSFQGGNDGYTPAGGVVFDKAGNLYGANSWGGSGGCPSPGCGTVFELSPPTQKGGAWTETTIYAFQGVLGSVKDGLTPEGGVIIDQQGNLYGTTSLGGNGPCILLGSQTGCGIVYELSPPAQKGGAWAETILYNFQGGTDGNFPLGDLVFDKRGNLYGATDFGGGKGTTCNPYYGGNCGTVFKLNRPEKKGGTWNEHVLHSFAGGTDGANPNGGFVFDSKGAVYGTTQFGGAFGYGTVFELEPANRRGTAWKETILHAFDPGPIDGGNPMAGVVGDAKGRLYGTTYGGGPEQGGIVFRFSPPSDRSKRWTEAILHGFDGNYWDEDGWGPECSLTFDSKGRLYGTTSNTAVDGIEGGVFRLTPRGSKWGFGSLYRFRGEPDGGQPQTGVILDKSGNVYGTTSQGGTGTGCSYGGCGTVFEVSLP
jgi:uncharacterized repeat protein (TIGR03803 family)